MRRWLCAGLAGAACAMAAACGRADDRVEVVYIPKSTGNPYFARIVEGLEAGCADLGCRMTTIGPATSDATSQLPILNAQIQRGVDVIAITPNSPDALNRAFDKARARGIKVVMLNSDIAGFEDRRDAAVMPVDFDRVGPSLLALMGQLMGHEGEFAILSATADAPDQNHFIAGITRTLADDPRYAAMTLVRIAYGDDEPQKSMTEAEVLLATHPRLKGILAPTAVGVLAAARVASAQRTRAIAVTGLGTPDLMRRYVKDGTVEAFQLWDPFEQGLLGAHLAMGLATGTVALEPGSTLAVPTLGAVKVRAKGVLLPREDLITFTRETIDSYAF